MQIIKSKQEIQQGIDQKEEELCRSIWDFKIITAKFIDERFIQISSEI